MNVAALSPEWLDQQFLTKVFQTLPERWEAPISERYVTQYKRQGRRAANLAMLDVVDALGGNWGVASSEDGLRAFADARVKECQWLYDNYSPQAYGDLYALGHMDNVALRYGIQPPAGRYVTTKGRRERFLCTSWWRRQARRVVARQVEGAAISVGLVHRRAGLYSSDDTVHRRRGQRARNRALLESLTAVNELGQAYTLQDLSDLGVSNPKIRRMELMTRIAGFDQVALEQGHAAEFYTITAPSKYHARDSQSGRENPTYQGYTPKETQEYLSKNWQRMRAKLHREGLTVYGFRVAEPHHDGTPHWHMVLFMQPDHVDQVRAILSSYALAEDGDEPGAAKHRFTAKAIDRSKGNAAGYLAKYIAKNIDGYGVGEDWEAAEGSDAATDSALRVDAWAATWGIRQFQQIGGASVGVWRELRRLDSETLEPGLLADLVAAAGAGDWRMYNNLNGGIFARRAERPAYTWRVSALDIETGEINLNKYGEIAADTVRGVFCGEAVLTRIHEWVFERRGATLPPWSSVNNCTGGNENGVTGEGQKTSRGTENGGQFGEGGNVFASRGTRKADGFSGFAGTSSH